MNVLVTGAAGYIGSAVCWKLLERGHAVIPLDNLKYGELTAVPPNLFLQVFDIANVDDQQRIREALSLYHIDAVCHLAAESLIPLSFEKPELFYRVNVIGGLMLLDAMRGAGVRRLIYSSTSSVYKENQPMPLTESSELGPSSVYGATKLAFEQTLPWMRELSWVAFRYFNVCGATEHCWEHPYHRSRIIPVAIDVARGRIPSMTINGTNYDTSDGTCIRDYVHVDDIAMAHCLALENPDIHGVFNLGIGTWYSNRRVIQTVGHVTNKSISVTDAPRRPGDPRALIANPSKAHLELGWQPQYKSLEEMIESAWRHEP